MCTDFFAEQERQRKEVREALPLHNRRYVIVYTRGTEFKAEVVSVDSESFAHAIFEAMLDVVDQQQANRRANTGRPFDFSLNMYRVSSDEPNRWAVTIGPVYTAKGRVMEPIDVRPMSGQYPLRGMDTDTYMGWD